MKIRFTPEMIIRLYEKDEEELVIQWIKNATKIDLVKLIYLKPDIITLILQVL